MKGALMWKVALAAAVAVDVALCAAVPGRARAGALESGWAQAAALNVGRMLPLLVNGTPVPAGSYPQVVRLSVAGSGCTGTIVGPRVVLTAAHCGDNGARVRFSAGGADHEAALEIHPRYGSAGGVDIAVVVLGTDIPGVTPAAIGGTPAVGNAVSVLGYGRTEPRNDSPPPDGQLRVGTSDVAEVTDTEFRIQREGGAIGHWGDSGGPAFARSEGRALLVGVLSHGPFTYDTTYFARTDSAAARSFLQDVARRRRVAICGVSGC